MLLIYLVLHWYAIFFHADSVPTDIDQPYFYQMALYCPLHLITE